ncbi:MAG TPA: hypothetical protein VFV31_01170 [Chitinophagaceae bacterium]|nr:hypothetical protein [Chitinophagaceae bacterium]
MKNRIKAALCAAMLYVSISAAAQQPNIPLNEPDPNKPLLFSNLPDRIPVNMDNLSRAMDFTVGNTVNLMLSDANQLEIDGIVTSTASKYNNSIQSVVIKSTNYNGAAFTISKITDANGQVSFTGRFISMQHGDLFELISDNSRYVLVKRKFYDLVNE